MSKEPDKEPEVRLPEKWDTHNKLVVRQFRQAAEESRQELKREKMTREIAEHLKSQPGEIAELLRGWIRQKH
ncbi:MAG: hypothetical protein KGR26_08585 [Cyanobacteria bacterium REEB65]|nr:hypothetical protein [Cyanobacteria bacterium REEB65]